MLSVTGAKPKRTISPVIFYSKSGQFAYYLPAKHLGIEDGLASTTTRQWRWVVHVALLTFFAFIAAVSHFVLQIEHVTCHHWHHWLIQIILRGQGHLIEWHCPLPAIDHRNRDFVLVLVLSRQFLKSNCNYISEIRTPMLYALWFFLKKIVEGNIWGHVGRLNLPHIPPVYSSFVGHFNVRIHLFPYVS